MDLDAWDWLEPDGDIPRGPAERRRRALLVARCIEYGGPLLAGARVSTLIPCPRRPGGRPCPGLLAVEKAHGGELCAGCPECGSLAARVRGWESTPWAAGPVAARDPQEPGEDDDAPEPRPADEADSSWTSIPDAVDRRLESVLREMGSSLDAATVRRHIALARTPSKVIEIVAGSGAIPDEAALEAVCDVLIDAWNHTPRVELGGRTPAQMSRAMAMPADAARMSAPARMAAATADAPCLCGSGAPAAQCCAPQFH